MHAQTKISRLCFDKLRVWIVGDLMLDRYVHGNADRISPEAPVPVLKVLRHEDRLGGCGNVAVNCRELGAETVVFGRVGADNDGRRCMQLLETNGISPQLWNDTTVPTTVKTRLMSDRQHMLRLDLEQVEELNPTAQRYILNRMDELPAPDLVIVSDYAKGVVTRNLVDRLLNLKPRPLILVDPKRPDLEFYGAVDYIKPNVAEIMLATGCYREDAVDVATLNRLQKRLPQVGLLVTRGADGMVLMEADGQHHYIRSYARRVFDVTGAGDTAAAVFGLCLVAGYYASEAANVANIAAGLVVAQPGTYALPISELAAALSASGEPAVNKLVSLEEAVSIRRDLARDNKRVVLTNGCFDVLHAGHTHLLRQARAHGDILFVALNSDASVLRLKGPKRPVNQQADRIDVLSSLSCVDHIILFDSNTPLHLIDALRPDVLVKGAGYEMYQIVGADIVLADGGQVERVPLLPGRSTTGILNRGNPLVTCVDPPPTMRSSA